MNQKSKPSETTAIIEKIQILSFVLDNEQFGIEISNIQEVLEFRSVTPVPRTPNYMLGVINLRGQVVSVIDLRRYFGMQLAETTVNSCIIIVEVKIDGEDTWIGLLADRVLEVVELEVTEISPAPRMGSCIHSDFINGIVKYDEHVVIILQVERIFNTGDLTEIQDITSHIENMKSNKKIDDH